LLDKGNLKNLEIIFRFLILSEAKDLSKGQVVALFVLEQDILKGEIKWILF
jgi:hypothetical protein